MNEVKAPCGGFTVDTNFLDVEGGKLYFRAEAIDTYGFIKGCCVPLIQHVSESSGLDRWEMDKNDIRLASTNAINGLPVFVRIMAYNGMDGDTPEYIYSTGNLCYFQKGKKLVFSCPQIQGSIFSVKFFDVDINTGIATITTKQLN